MLFVRFSKGAFLRCVACHHGFGSTEVSSTRSSVSFGTSPRQSIPTSAATPLSRLEYCAKESAETDFRSIFERALIPAARYSSQGVIGESNLAFPQSPDPNLAKERIWRLCDLVPPRGP